MSEDVGKLLRYCRMHWFALQAHLSTLSAENEYDRLLATSAKGTKFRVWVRTSP